MKRIAIAADHRGYVLKSDIIKEISDIVWTDCGTHSGDRVDYPQFVLPAVQLLKNTQVDACILICGSGAGMAIAANRHKGVHAAVVWDLQSARIVKEDDNCNVLVLPADFVSSKNALEMIHVWLNTNFKGGRYAHRLAMIDQGILN